MVQEWSSPLIPLLFTAGTSACMLGTDIWALWSGWYWLSTAICVTHVPGWAVTLDCPALQKQERGGVWRWVQPWIAPSQTTPAVERVVSKEAKKGEEKLWGGEEIWKHCTPRVLFFTRPPRWSSCLVIMAPGRPVVLASLPCNTYMAVTFRCLLMGWFLFKGISGVTKCVRGVFGGNEPLNPWNKFNMQWHSCFCSLVLIHGFPLTSCGGCPRDGISTPCPFRGPSSSCPPFTGFHLLPMMFVADCTCILAALFGKRGYDLSCRWSHSSPTLEKDEKEFYFCLIYFTYCSDSLNGILVWSAGILPPQ